MKKQDAFEQMINEMFEELLTPPESDTYEVEVEFGDMTIRMDYKHFVQFIQLAKDL